MFLRISDKATDIRYKSIVLSMSIYPNYIVKTLNLDLSETQERYVLACVPSVVTEEGFLSGQSRRVVLSVILPIEQVSDRPMLAIVFERPLVVTKE